MFDELIEDLKRIEMNLKFKTNEIRYSTEFLEMKDDLKIAGTHLKSASKNVGKICKKVFNSERFTQLINEQV